VGLYRDEAIVLRTWKLGEADRIVSFHTLNHGKVRAVAKGVRRTRSKLGSRVELASRVAVQLYRGRSDLQTLTQAEVIERFTAMRAEPERFAQASAMLEAVEQVATEDDPDEQRHVMLARALAALDRIDSPLILAGFLLKLLALEGVQPQLGCCAACGSTEPLTGLDVELGGTVCAACRRGIAVSEAALATMRLIVSDQLAIALKQDGGTADDEVTNLAVTLMESHLERRLRAVSVLGRC